MDRASVLASLPADGLGRLRPAPPSPTRATGWALRLRTVRGPWSAPPRGDGAGPRANWALPRPEARRPSLPQRLDTATASWKSPFDHSTAPDDEGFPGERRWVGTVLQNGNGGRFEMVRRPR